MKLNKKLLLLAIGLVVPVFAACSQKPVLNDKYDTQDISFNYNKASWIVHDAVRGDDGTYLLYMYRNFEGEEDTQNYVLIEFARTLEVEFDEFLASTETEDMVHEETVENGVIKYVLTEEEGKNNFNCYKRTDSADIIFHAGYKNKADLETLKKIMESIEIKHDYNKEYSNTYRYLADSTLKYGTYNVPVYAFAFGDNLDVEGYNSSIAYDICVSNEIIDVDSEYEMDAILKSITAEEYAHYQGEVQDMKREMSEIRKIEGKDGIYNYLIFSDDEGMYRQLLVSLQKFDEGKYLLTIISRMRGYTLNSKTEPALNELLTAYGVNFN